MATPDKSEPITVQNVYFNGFQLGLSNADISGMLLLNNVPTMSVSMSYTTAKTLSAALVEMIGALEKVTGREIMTTQQVGEGLEKLSSEGKSDGNVH